MLSEEVKNEIIKLYEKGFSKNRIAKRLRISWDSVNRVLKSRSRGIENVREEFERFSRIAEYESELDAMKREIRAKENDSKNIKLAALEKKVDWAIQNKDYINEEVMEMIRGEFREIIGIPPKEKFEEMLMHYKEIRRFEEAPKGAGLVLGKSGGASIALEGDKTVIVSYLSHFRQCTIDVHGLGSCSEEEKGRS